MKTAGMAAAVLGMWAGLAMAQGGAVPTQSPAPVVRESVPENGSAGAAQDAAADGDTSVADAARVLRLSQIRGHVRMDRNTGGGFEFVLPNVPVMEGNKLQTTDGFAEVQLEDGSTLRLAPNTLVEFTKLSAGESVVTLAQGTLYVSAAQAQTMPLTVGFAGQRLTAEAGSRLRADVELPVGMKVTVFAGAATSAGSAGAAELHGPETLVYTAKAGGSGLDGTRTEATAERGPYDAWDREEIRYAKKYGNNPSAQGLAAAYGGVDLNYYGDFFEDAECGLVWRPYLVDASWDPYGTGIWMWSPLADDYMWVSLYPWGWLPYHSGEWAVCGAGGWAWRPGRRFVTVGNRPGRFLKQLPGRPGRPAPPKPPVRPPHPPTRLTMLLVGRPAISRLRDGVLQLPMGSAGMGVVRGSVPLAKISREMKGYGGASYEVKPREMDRVEGIPPGREAHSVMEENWRSRVAAGGAAGNGARGFAGSANEGAGSRSNGGSRGDGRGSGGSNHDGGNRGEARGSGGSNGGGSHGESRPSGGFNGGGGARPAPSAPPPPPPSSPPAPSAPAAAPSHH